MTIMTKKMIGKLRRYRECKKLFHGEICRIVLDRVPFRSYLFAIKDDEFEDIPIEWSGHHSSVTFDPYYIYQIVDDDGGLAGFYHTHPPRIGEASPSPTDITTMNAWVKCLGQPLHCWIDNGWDIACWYFDTYGHFRLTEFNNLAVDPLEYELRITR